MWRKGAPVLVGGLVTVAAAFVFARIQGGFVPWFVFDFTLVAFVYEALVWQRGARTVTVHRTVSVSHVATGGMVDVELRVERHGWWPVLWLRVRDELPPGLRPETGRADWWLLPLWAPVREIHYRIRAERRGVYTLPPLRVETGDLFGLQRRARETGQPVRLVAFPAVVPVHRLTGHRRLPAETRQRTLRRTEESMELAGVREWWPGDRLNRVHWPSTARAGRLQSKAFELQAMGGWVFIVDALRSSYVPASGGAGPDERFELAMSIAASLVRRAAQWQWPAQLWLLGARWRELPVGSQPGMQLEALEQLAAAAPDGSGVWADRLKQAAARLPAGTAVVLVSPQVSEAAASVLAAVGARHSVEWMVPQPPGTPAPTVSTLARLAEARVRVHVIHKLAELAVPGRGGGAYDGVAPSRA